MNKLHSAAKTLGAPEKRDKFEARNPELETMSNDQKPNVPNKFVFDLSLGF
jgi:hypothetical protein